MATPETRKGELERPTAVEVGQRWGSKSGERSAFTVHESPWSTCEAFTLLRWDGQEPGGVWPTRAIPIDFDFLGYAPGFAPAPTPVPGMAAAVTIGQRRKWTSSEAFQSHFTVMEGRLKPLRAAYDAGGGWECDEAELLRDSVLLAGDARPPAVPVAPTPAVAPEYECTCTRADNRHWGYCPQKAVEAEMRAARTAAAPVEPVTPTVKRREVSTNGRDWLNYDRLTDADPFEAYRWRRWMSPLGAWQVTTPPEPRGYHGHRWPDHLEQERMVAEEMAFHEKHLPRKPQAEVPERSPRQSHLLGVGAVGIWALREEGRRR